MQLDGVDQVAVVGQRELAVIAGAAGAAVDRLRVLPRVGAGRRIAHVPDRQIAAERAQVVLLEHLVDEPHRALGDDVAALVGGRDPGRFLAAVLERVQREVRQAGDVVPGAEHAEYAALVARSVAPFEIRVGCGHRTASLATATRETGEPEPSNAIGWGRGAVAPAPLSLRAG